MASYIGAEVETLILFIAQFIKSKGWGWVIHCIWWAITPTRFLYLNVLINLEIQQIKERNFPISMSLRGIL